MAEEIKSEETVASEDVEKIDSTSESTSGSNEATAPTEPKKIENLEKALRIFKRKSAGIISEVRKREAYDSPSVKRKKKSKEARKQKKNYRFNSSY